MFQRSFGLSLLLFGLFAVSPSTWVAEGKRYDAASANQGANGWHIAFSSQQNIVPPPPASLDFDPRMQLYVMDGDGFGQKQITNFFGVKLGDECSPNGQLIAFHGAMIMFASRPTVPTIFVMDADGLVGPDGTGATEIVSGGRGKQCGTTVRACRMIDGMRPIRLGVKELI